MNRFLPSLPLSVTVFVLWVLLVADVGTGQLLLAAALAVALPLMAGALQPERARFGRGWAIVRLARRVLWDMLLSNIEVARRILGPEKHITPGFLWLPLDVSNLHGITALASIITLTPGTLSAELAEDRRHLLIHSFNLRDADDTIARIKQRYESLLREIFP
ncbi:MAG: Na+/H+ antiporter subunit E [Pseudomonadota bacterium]|nr:Na+/H+ antiporter subunit E [Pseudomonadota bacterium]